MTGKPGERDRKLGDDPGSEGESNELSPESRRSA